MKLIWGNFLALGMIFLEAIQAKEVFRSHSKEYVYVNHQIYHVQSTPGVPTDIQIPASEKVMGFALGDTVQWLVEELPGHLFVKPIKPGLFTAGTLVTNKHVYVLQFKSVALEGNWDQTISWVYESGSHKLETGSSLVVNSDVAAPVKRNTDYGIKGEGNFVPKQVFDDGRFTWIEMNNPQDLPALFMVSEGQTVLVNYLVKDHYFLVQRLMPEILLKFGEHEVHVINKHYVQ